MNNGVCDSRCWKQLPEIRVPKMTAPEIRLADIRLAEIRTAEMQAPEITVTGVISSESTWPDGATT